MNNIEVTNYVLSPEVWNSWYIFLQLVIFFFDYINCKPLALINLQFVAYFYNFFFYSRTSPLKAGLQKLQI